MPAPGGAVGLWVADDADDSAEGDPRVVQALREYRAALDAGRRPNRPEFLARYADVAAELAPCLEGLDFVRAAAREVLDLIVLDEAIEDPATPAALGDFRVLREAGRGGMGIVYEAEQVSLGRRVALKVLPAAAALDARQLQRFRNEVQAAAHLQHPHIVPVLAVGCEAGIPYYAMQFVDGRSLADVIAAARRGGPGPGPLGEQAAYGPEYFRAVARLLVEAAEALEYAHQCGVVHRDVKPANLLVDGRGHLWVTDFGLARVGGGPGAGVTAPGDVLGTVHYMSPEQAVGDHARLDHRTDIYSLGATAYELLTLRPPFAGENRAVLVRRIAADDPRRARRVSSAVPRDLETIVAKAMEKNPADRYATARELADDLTRFLECKPIRARRATPWQVAAKWARRHRPVVTAVAVAGAVVVAVLVLAVVWLSITKEELREQQQKTARQAALNEQTADAAFQAVHRVMLDLADDRLRSDPLWGQKAEGFLDFTVKICGDLAEMEGASPTLRTNAVNGFRRAAWAYNALGRGDKAKAALVAGLAHGSRLVEEAPDDFSFRYMMASGHREYALLLRGLGEDQAAVEQFQKALDVWITPRPIQPCPYEASETHENLGDLRAGEGDPDGAESHYRVAMKLRQRLQSNNGGAEDVSLKLANDYRRLGGYRRRAGDRPTAEADLRAALKLAEQLVATHPDVPGYVLCLGLCCHDLGSFYESSDRKAALNYYARALAPLPKLIETHPVLPSPRLLQADIHMALGELTGAKAPAGQQTRADHFRKARDVLTKLADDLPGGAPSPGEPGMNQNTLAWLLATCPDHKFRDPARAVELATRAVERAPKHPEYWNTYGAACYAAGDMARAAAALEKAVAYRAGGGDAYDYLFLAMARWQLGDRDEALTAHTKALLWLKRFPGAETTELARVRSEAEKLLGYPGKEDRHAGGADGPGGQAIPVIPVIGSGDRATDHRAGSGATARWFFFLMSILQAARGAK
jgi:tetratricopeptide (TPR) repeat protein